MYYYTSCRFLEKDSCEMYGPENKEYEPKSIEKADPIPTEPIVNKDESTESNDYSAPEYWDEDKSPEGYTYYWNTVTGGT